MTKTFEDLICWKKAHELTLEVYNLTSGFPEIEKFGITSQIRRSISSVPANIAEGYSRKTKKDKTKFFNIALSSLEESRYFLILSRDLGLIHNFHSLNQKSIEIRKLLSSYTSSLNQNS